uniref:Small ribosomal subunit protein uS3c n=1 Tax=Oogamochlamys gigantea TaxID=158507 RepID=A0A0S2LMZ0_9CHLO|nr:ribosomal protein S3 [Oogamochlamys gigantea]ALO62818.1 ribosomal protein S3 [Oogamochlamys gigantea]
MGQKVHPLGFRVGITKKHQSQWFARFHKNSYAQSVLEDRMLRNTLIKLFPDLLNPVLKKIKSRQQETKVTPKITQIKIERGLIPYEIGIQIHAQNCELIKFAIDKLKIDRDLACYLQKAQKFLLYLGQKAKLDLEKIALKSGTTETNLPSQGIEQGVTLSRSKKKILKRVKTRRSPSKITRSSFFPYMQKDQAYYASSSLVRRSPLKKLSGRKSKKNFKRGPKLTKQQYKKKKLIQKRLRKRQNIRFRFYEFITKGLFIKKKIMHSLHTVDFGSARKEKHTPSPMGLIGIPFFERKIKSKKKKLNKFKPWLRHKKSTPKTLNKSSITTISTRSKSTSSINKVERKSQLAEKKLNKQKTSTTSQSKKPNVFITRIKKKIQEKFLTIYLTKMNKHFLKELKKMMKGWVVSSPNPVFNRESQFIQNLTQPKIRFSFFGYSKKWNLNKLKSFKKQPIPKLLKLVQILESKISKKMETLKKYFIFFGRLSKTQAYSFYQIMIFLKYLKNLIRQRFVRLRLGLTNQVLSNYTKQKAVAQATKTPSKVGYVLETEQRSSKLTKSNMKTKKVLLKIINNLDYECRKIKFIEYLKDIVKKHRTKNIFYYLSTLSKASKDLKQTKKYTLKHAQFLFGLDLKNPTLSQETNFIKNRITSVLEQSNKNKIYVSLASQGFEQALRDSLINQIEKEKLISKENLKLNPKISIKFYSVKKQSLEIKASVIAESIVDALEKRKAFRKVIKSAKENLMEKQRVKGVKIQVAGRLNGAEIARTEWVRAGRVPLQTLRANIDFSYQTANTIYGIIGVKVWIFKGYTKTI